MAYTTIDDPTLYFSTTLYTGNAADDRAVTIDGTGMQPDMVWNKSRSLGEAHVLGDSVRGVQRKIVPNANDGQSSSGSFTNFSTITSTGFTVSKGGVDGAVNQNAATYCNWAWKAGTSFTNDASGTSIGSIDSAGSVSSISGFGICTHTGTGSAGTIKHGLSTIPNVIITKILSEANDWAVLHSGGVADYETDRFIFNEASAAGDSDVVWNDTKPTASVFSVGTSNMTNKNTATYVSYLFHDVQGYSKFGSFIGNGNADGAFIYTGFSPAWVVVKRRDDDNGWLMNDNKRSPFNVSNAKLEINLGSAESSFVALDFLSNGFKVRTSDADLGASSGIYTYMAFAQQPFVTSTGVPATAR